jgi:hypothetical protein
MHVEKAIPLSIRATSLTAYLATEHDGLQPFSSLPNILEIRLRKNKNCVKETPDVSPTVRVPVSM